MTEPTDCPTPAYHETHYYCPNCTFTADDAPVSEAEAQRGRADALHAQLGETLAKLSTTESALAESRGEVERLREALTRISHVRRKDAGLTIEQVAEFAKDRLEAPHESEIEGLKTKVAAELVGARAAPFDLTITEGEAQVVAARIMEHVSPLLAALATAEHERDEATNAYALSHLAHAATISQLAAAEAVIAAAEEMVDAIDEQPSLEWIVYASRLNDALIGYHKATGQG